MARTAAEEKRAKQDAVLSQVLSQKSSAREAASREAARRRGAVFVRLFAWVFAAFAAVAAVGVGGYFLADALPVESPVDAPATGAEDLADFRLPTLEGRELGPPDYRGQVVVAELWATWCGPCRLQAQYIEQVRAEYADDEVAFLAINTGEEKAKVRQYVAKTPFPYPVLLDPAETLSERFGVSGLPTVMVVDPQGRIVYLKTGVQDATTLKEQIEAARS